MSNLTVHWGDETRLLTTRDGQNLLELLAGAGISVYAPCKGNGSCHKCRVTYRSQGRTESVLACQTTVAGDGEVWVPRVSGGGLTEYEAGAWQDGAQGIGAAVDIGTTTVAAALVDCASGQTIGTQAMLNPQQVCGADVISRICACGEGKLALQTGLIREAVASLLRALCSQYGIVCLENVTVCGNTTMLHLFCGVDPTPIGTAPFTPVFTQMRQYAGAEIGIPADTVYVLPSASGYIGSDIVCGILAQQWDHNGIRLLADLGTNGELALCKGDALLCASTAAGPALEGANIECGIGGIPGAICGVTLEHGALEMRTIDGKPPVGICGSGLVDIIALLVELGILDESGCFDPECGHPLASRLEEDRFLLTDKIWVSQKDIRQFQLAKAAIHAGILTLCGCAGVDPADVDTLCIAGGLGFYLRQESALGVGLIPRAFSGKLRSVGNSGLAGAVRCLLPEGRKAATETAERIRVCELSGRSDFAEQFVESMSFDA